MGLNRWIVSELKGPESQPLVVSTDGTNVVTGYLDLEDENQQWYVMGNLYKGGFQGLFYSPAFDSYLSAPEDGGPVVMTNTIDESSMWTAATSGNDWALRPYRNGDVNMNIAGEATAAGTQILAYHWGGGAANEVWDTLAYQSASRLAG